MELELALRTNLQMSVFELVETAGQVAEAERAGKRLTRARTTRLLLNIAIEAVADLQAYQAVRSLQREAAREIGVTAPRRGGTLDTLLTEAPRPRTFAN